MGFADIALSLQHNYWSIHTHHEELFWWCRYLSLFLSVSFVFPGSLSLLACICLGGVPSSFLSGQSNSTPETHPLNRALQYLKPGTSHRLMPSCSFLLCGTKLLLSSFPWVIVDLRVILTSWSQVFFLYLSVCQLTSRRALPSFPFSILSQ